jgi:ABC-2 type transport system ATP-binding protein
VATGSPDELKRELSGDAVQVELERPELNGARPALEGLAGIREISVEGRTVRARAADGARAVPAVLAALETHGVGVASVTVARPSLDDVYLRYAGRPFAKHPARPGAPASLSFGAADDEEVSR